MSKRVCINVTFPDDVILSILRVSLGRRFPVVIRQYTHAFIHKEQMGFINADINLRDGKWMKHSSYIVVFDDDDYLLLKDMAGSSAGIGKLIKSIIYRNLSRDFIYRACKSLSEYDGDNYCLLLSPDKDGDIINNRADLRGDTSNLVMLCLPKEEYNCERIDPLLLSFYIKALMRSGDSSSDTGTSEDEIDESGKSAHMNKNGVEKKKPRLPDKESAKILFPDKEKDGAPASSARSAEGETGKHQPSIELVKNDMPSLEEESSLSDEGVFPDEQDEDKDRLQDPKKQDQSDGGDLFDLIASMDI